jgi:FkbM family methyltransferase
MADSSTGLISKSARFAFDFFETSRLNYTFAERANLVRARLSRGNKTKVLDFTVRKLNQGSFRIILWEIFFKGEYQFRAGIEDPVIFDCGANIGLATLFFKHIYPKARITAFEADPDTFRVLQANVTENRLEAVSVHQLMLANGEGERSFYSGGGEAGNLMGSINPGRNADHSEIKVKAARLSTFVDRRVDFLKLDVEGSEFDVLTDLVNSGKIAEIQRMVIEYHHKIGGADSCLAGFLKLIEDQGFEYQIAATGCEPISRTDVCQDILIGAYRPVA